MTESGFAEQHAGQERAHRHRQSAQLHQQRGAQHHQQCGGGHDFARLGGGQDAEQRIEQEPPYQHQANDGTGSDADADPARRTAHLGMHRRHQGDHGQQRHDQQVFEQQD